MKLDILVIVAHPDDAELSCGGTLAKHSDLGYKTGVIDLTQGELGTRGSVEIRYKEATEASKILGLSVRENMKFRDGWFKDDDEHRLKIINRVRFYQPDIIITNAIKERHPDHARAANLVKESAWLAGLAKIETLQDGEIQKPWRPRHVYHIIQSDALTPDFIVDISGYVDKKIQAIKAYSSQFFNPQSHEPETYLSRSTFLSLIESRNVSMANYGMIEQAEGFISSYKPAVKNIFDLI